VTPKLENGVVNGHSKDGNVSEAASEGGEGHPSSTVAPVTTTPLPRPSAPRPAESPWTALDLGGMRLKNVAPELFKFDYLTTLYLNHNQLTHVAPAISQLRHLTVLDLSSNQLDTVPPELGMCTSLEHLWLFDNNIETLPPELGSLHQLKMLGIEGNPLQASLASIIQTQGTPALIAYLRDSCPVPMPPPERVWKVLQSEAERKMQDADPSSETFTLLTYNILCEKFATSTMYGYTPSWALSWNYRKELILTEIINYEADFLCLQVRVLLATMASSGLNSKL
jgi:CCR4-NOT transcription complex subunit 6